MAEPALALVNRTELTMPTLIAAAGKSASMRFLEFFTFNISNENTRAPYSRAAGVCGQDHQRALPSAVRSQAQAGPAKRRTLAGLGEARQPRQKPLCVGHAISMII